MNGKAPWIVGVAAALIMVVGGLIVINWVNWVSATILETSKGVIEIRSDQKAVKEDVGELKEGLGELKDKLDARLFGAGR